jgi:hypothetical protein
MNLQQRIEKYEKEGWTYTDDFRISFRHMGQPVYSTHKALVKDDICTFKYRIISDGKIGREKVLTRYPEI